MLWLSLILPLLSPLLGFGGGGAGRRGGTGGRQSGLGGLLGGLSPVSLVASFCLQSVGSWLACIADRGFTRRAQLCPDKAPPN